MRKITILDVCREMGVDLEPKAAWSAGSTMAEMWKDETGELPEKQLRTKTCGTGSHCFAVYPESWRERIREVIERVGYVQKAQLNLFD